MNQNLSLYDSKNAVLFCLLTLFCLGFFLLMPRVAQAQTVCAQLSVCNSAQECINAGCPTCADCIDNQCVTVNQNCDDGNVCTDDLCLFDPNNNIEGCFNISPVLNPDPAERPDDLPIECYICEPTANNVVVNNGICDPGAGENCANSADCQVVGETCATPPPPQTCDTQLPVCQDGDVCTDDVCVFVIGAPDQCSNPLKSCSPIPDGCCPAGCDGPDPDNIGGCFDDQAQPIANCDADCWFPQACGDGLVQAPETCDDSADAADAGISPLGQTVTNEQCRDAGSAAECTYCGDGIVQAAAGEQCDLNNDSACGTDGCDLSTCQCAQNLCVTGSGNPIDTIRTGCGNCSLQKDVVSKGWQSYAIWFGGFFLLSGAWLLRRRQSRT